MGQWLQTLTKERVALSALTLLTPKLLLRPPVYVDALMQTRHIEKLVTSISDTEKGSDSQGNSV